MGAKQSTEHVSIPAMLDSLSIGSWRNTGKHLAENSDVVILPFWHAALAPALTGELPEQQKSMSPAHLRIDAQCILP